MKNTEKPMDSLRKSNTMCIACDKVLFQYSDKNYEAKLEVCVPVPLLLTTN